MTPDPEDPTLPIMILQPPPRWMTDLQIRKHFGISERAFYRLRAMPDFPRKNDLLNRTDSKLVDFFFDELSGLPTPKSWSSREDGVENFDDEPRIRSPRRIKKPRF